MMITIFCLLIAITLAAPFGISPRKIPLRMPRHAQKPLTKKPKHYPTGPVFTLAMQVCQGSGKATLHGLWPDWVHQDCSTAPFEENLIEDLLTDMESEWPSCQGEAEPNFWSHEWTKHGRCSGMEEHAYFKKALELLDVHGPACEQNPSQCRICLDDKTYNVAPCPKKLGGSRRKAGGSRKARGSRKAGGPRKAGGLRKAGGPRKAGPRMSKKGRKFFGKRKPQNKPRGSTL